MSRARVTYDCDYCVVDEDLQIGDFKKESKQTAMNKPKSCVRCGFSGNVSDFPYGKCPKCKEPADYKDLPCPVCNTQGWLSRSGWICPKCPDPNGMNDQGALYHRCKDKVVRIIPKSNMFKCSVCGNPTWVNAPEVCRDFAPYPGLINLRPMPSTEIKENQDDWWAQVLHSKAEHRKRETKRDTSVI